MAEVVDSPGSNPPDWPGRWASCVADATTRLATRESALDPTAADQPTGAESSKVEIKVAHVGADGGPRTEVVDDPSWRTVMRVEVRQADGVVVGDRNRQRNYLRHEVKRPKVRFDAGEQGASFVRAFEALVERPDSWLRREVFRKVVAAPRPVPTRRDRAVFTTRPKFGGRSAPARPAACAVRLRSSRGVAVGDHNRQTNHFGYRVEKPQAALASVLAGNPQLVHRLIAFIADPVDAVVEQRLHDSIKTAVEGSVDRLFFHRPAGAEIGRTGGVMIGEHNRQTNVTRTYLSQLDTKSVVDHIRRDALEVRAVNEFARHDRDDRREAAAIEAIGRRHRATTSPMPERDVLEIDRLERSRLDRLASWESQVRGQHDLLGREDPTSQRRRQRIEEGLSSVAERRTSIADAQTHRETRATEIMEEMKRIEITRAALRAEQARIEASRSAELEDERNRMQIRGIRGPGF